MSREFIGYIFIVCGLLFDFFGCLGLIRLPDVYNRLQAATKCTTLGTCGILFGVFIISLGETEVAVKALLCIVFILLTSPVGAHAIARAAYLTGIPLWKGSVVNRYGEEKGNK